jgi:hypothetical protein
MLVSARECTGSDCLQALAVMRRFRGSPMTQSSLFRCWYPRRNEMGAAGCIENVAIRLGLANFFAVVWNTEA